MDTLSLSRSALGSAVARLGRLMPSSKAALVSSENASACGHGNVAPDQSDSLVEGDASWLLVMHTLFLAGPQWMCSVLT